MRQENKYLIQMLFFFGNDNFLEAMEVSVSQWYFSPLSRQKMYLFQTFICTTCIKTEQNPSSPQRIFPSALQNLCRKWFFMSRWIHISSEKFPTKNRVSAFFGSLVVFDDISRYLVKTCNSGSHCILQTAYCKWATIYGNIPW